MRILFVSEGGRAAHIAGMAKRRNIAMMNHSAARSTAFVTFSPPFLARKLLLRWACFLGRSPSFLWQLRQYETKRSVCNQLELDDSLTELMRVPRYILPSVKRNLARYAHVLIAKFRRLPSTKRYLVVRVQTVDFNNVQVLLESRSPVTEFVGNPLWSWRPVSRWWRRWRRWRREVFNDVDV